ncbi:hypothetical protein AAC387_Pa01g2908 [Persea americana]|eukprot:TRINITY_DN3724_c0_g1_i3.p1 TRINITY_DN3724_c0_g1~~TRINITY_DN3724_c0_g1_i3.p1  ORF type:complete len:260 (+),score=56.15 TRINITY_DN3724_c0_g1_i3:215-994(+)
MENSLEGLELVPTMLRRYYSVMRDLDKSLQGWLCTLLWYMTGPNELWVGPWLMQIMHHQFLQQENEQRCEKEIEDIKGGVQSGNITPDTSLIRFSDDALDEQKHSIRIADEKVALAGRAYDMVDAYIQQLDDCLKKFDNELRRERDLASAAGVAAANLDGGTRSGRGSESSKAGRKKTRLAAAAAAAVTPSMDLDLPVDPNEPTYCFCNQVSYGEMIACDSPNCKIEWFHYDCVGLKDTPRGKWYCSNCATQHKRRKGK